MSTIELLPIDKGNGLILDHTSVTTIGRTPNIGCLDKKISRNHAELHVKSDGTVWIKPIHHNPTFYRTKSQQLVTLTKDQEFQLNDNDEIGLLPDEYFYRISIKSKDEERPEPSVVPKSPRIERELTPIRSPVEEPSPKEDRRLEPEGGIILHTTRALPTWMSNSAVSTSKTTKGRGKGKEVGTPTKPTASPSKYRTYIGRKKAEGVVYDEDDEESNEASAVSTDQTVLKPVGPTKRERCPYGKFCYRKNPAHRQEAIHPGDPDWDNKENDADDQKPECPYGTDCYRKNPDHFNEYSHTGKGASTNKTKQRPSKRKRSGDDEEDDDDDGLPNEYDYDDSFIDDDQLEESVRVDRAVTGNSQADPDSDWKPHRKARHSDRDDGDEENNSTDESELSLLKDEAAEFVQNSTIDQQRPAKKKARVHIPDGDDDN